MITFVLVFHLIFLFICVIGSIMEDCAPLAVVTTVLFMLNLYILSLLW